MCITTASPSGTTTILATTAPADNAHANKAYADRNGEIVGAGRSELFHLPGAKVA